MLAFSNALSDVTYKFHECITNKPTNKCVIQANRHNNTGVCVKLYKHQSLAHLHNIITHALQVQHGITYNNDTTTYSIDVNNHIELISMPYVTDYIPPINHIQKEIDSSEIYDLFICSNDSKKRITSIPYDDNITLLEFMLDHSTDIKKVFSPISMSMAYNIYIIDKSFLKKIKKTAHLL